MARSSRLHERTSCEKSPSRRSLWLRGRRGHADRCVYVGFHANFMILAVLRPSSRPMLGTGRDPLVVTCLFLRRQQFERLPTSRGYLVLATSILNPHCSACMRFPVLRFILRPRPWGPFLLYVADGFLTLLSFPRVTFPCSSL